MAVTRTGAVSRDTTARAGVTHLVLQTLDLRDALAAEMPATAVEEVPSARRAAGVERRAASHIDRHL